MPLVHAVLEELPDLERVIAGEPLTLVHYDAYPPNIAFARHNPQADAVLIDWALASCDLGETDLAFLF